MTSKIDPSGQPLGSRRFPSLAGLLAAACGLLLLAAAAASASAAPPTVSIEPVTASAYTTAHVSGEVNPEGGGPYAYVEWSFQLSTDGGASWECPSGATCPSGVIAGPEAETSTPVALEGTLEGLRPGTGYLVRLHTFNFEEEVNSAEPNPAFTTEPVAAPTVSIVPVTSVTGTTAELVGHINPNAPAGPLGPAAEAAYRINWHFQCTPECPGLGSGGVVEADDADHEVSVEASELLPHTTYEVLLIAENAAGPVEAGPETFTTLAIAPLIGSTFTTDADAEAADLGAEIDPGGAATTYHFDYGTTEAYGHSTPESGSIGADNTEHGASAHLPGLQPATTYHYRVVAENSAGAPTVGPDHTFTTQPAASPFALPDGRAWEMVSPPDKFGATLEGINKEGGLIEASADGTALTYVANAPIEADPEGNPSLSLTQILARRAEGGWSSRGIATPHDEATGVQAGHLGEYTLFDPDLSAGVVEQQRGDETLLSPQATERSIYLRDSATGSYEPLVTASNVPPGTRFGGSQLSFEGATPDLAHIVIESKVALTDQPITEGGLYEWTAGHPRLVSVLPDGEPAPNPVLGSAVKTGGSRDAISLDGSRVVFSEGPQEERPQREHLYLRLDAGAEPAPGGECSETEPAKACTVQLDAVQGGSGAGALNGDPRFQLASTAGSQIFFTDEQQLTPGSGAGENQPDLYVFDANTGTLSDLTVNHLEPTEPAAVQGAILGAAEDAGIVYFVAHGVLAGNENSRLEGAVSGAPNLYSVSLDGGVWQPPHFIATLSPADAPSWGSQEFFSDLDETHLKGLTAGTSPDGRYLAFMSQRPLTGYDNHDLRGGESDEEVFLYAAGPERLSCVSCDPTGARPRGVFDPGSAASGSYYGLLIDRPESWEGHWLAADIPGWTPEELTRSFYRSRYLSDSGRLFFNSVDPLDPRDVNGLADVYEFEPQGVGSCQNPQGCVSMLSGGASGEESAFIDASQSGDDAFFLTAAKLRPEDVDDSLDVYDAHVCTAELPCPPPPPPSPPACDGDACQLPAVPPAAGTPGSLTFNGAGNVKECAKGKKLQKGRCVKQAKKNHHKKSHKKHHKNKGHGTGRKQKRAKGHKGHTKGGSK